MGKFRDFTRHLQQFTIERQETDLLKIVKKHEPYAVDLNIEQMMKGVDSNNEEIRPPYKPFTIQIKEEKGQPTDRVTLRDEGSFHQLMFMGADKWPAIFNSADPKTEDLKGKYGKDIMGHNEESRWKLSEEIKPDVIEYYGGIISL